MSHDGLTARITKGGIPVLRVHYSADWRKDPKTVEGLRWLADASLGYPQGLQDPAWRKEMEIEYGAPIGLPVPLWPSGNVVELPGMLRFKNC